MTLVFPGIGIPIICNSPELILPGISAGRNTAGKESLTTLRPQVYSEQPHGSYPYQQLTLHSPFPQPNPVESGACPGSTELLSPHLLQCQRKKTPPSVAAAAPVPLPCSGEDTEGLGGSHQSSPAPPAAGEGSSSAPGVNGNLAFMASEVIHDPLKSILTGRL